MRRNGLREGERRGGSDEGKEWQLKGHAEGETKVLIARRRGSGQPLGQPLHVSCSRGRVVVVGGPQAAKVVSEASKGGYTLVA